MSSLKSTTVVLAVSAIMSFAGSAKCQGMWNRKSKVGDGQASLNTYIGDMAIRFDCYFTIEGMHRGADNWIEVHQNVARKGSIHHRRNG